MRTMLLVFLSLARSLSFQFFGASALRWSPSPQNDIQLLWNYSPAQMVRKSAFLKQPFTERNIYRKFEMIFSHSAVIISSIRKRSFSWNVSVCVCVGSQLHAPFSLFFSENRTKNLRRVTMNSLHSHTPSGKKRAAASE